MPMLEFDSLGILRDYSTLYRDFSLPAFICGTDFEVRWSNAPAKSFFPHLTVENGLLPLLSEFDAENFIKQLSDGVTCRVDGAVGLSGAKLNLLPILKEKALMGVIVIIIPVSDIGPVFGASHMSKTPEILESGVRRSVDAMFKAMDDASLKADMLSSGWIKQSFDSISMSGYYILRLALNLSQFSMYQAYPPMLKLSSFDIFKRINDMSGIIDGISDRIGIPVRVTMPDAACFLSADIDKLELAFFNIVNNALYFTKPGNAVDITGEDGISSVILTVTDRGAGIPVDILPYVTKPYFTYNKSGSAEGAGLGLAVAKLIIDTHGGILDVKSKENEGTTVTVQLPKRVFSQSAVLRQSDVPNSSSRFSSPYVGLIGALLSPYRFM